MPTVPVSLLTDLVELSDRAYAGHDLLASQTLPAGWRYVTPGELGMQLLGITLTGQLRFGFNGVELVVDQEGFFVGSLFDTNAMYIAINDTLGKVAVVFRGTDNFFTDYPISFGNIASDNLDEELSDFNAVFDAIASYITASGGIAQGFEIISTGHSLGGALAAELLNYRAEINWGLGIGAPGMTVNASNEFIVVRHQNDLVGNLFSERFGSNDIILQDFRFSSDSTIDAHFINNYQDDMARLSASGVFRDQVLSSGSSVYISNNATGMHGLVPSEFQWVLGSSASDQIDGSQATSGLRIEGGTGGDSIRGGGSADVLAGGAGNDQLFGNDGSDTIFGDDEADMLEGGRGNDLLVGGAGNDYYVLRLGDGFDAIEERQAGSFDVLQLFGGSLITSTSQLHYSATAFDLTISAIDLVGNTVMSLTIKDMATEGSRVEQLQLYGSGGNFVALVDLNQVWTNVAGINLIQPPAATGFSYLTGTVGIDTVFLDWSGLSSAIYTTYYQDRSAGIEGTEYVTALGNVVVNYRDVESLFLIGGSGSDFLRASFYQQETLPHLLEATIFGNEGDDLIVGRGGPDHLYGGSGNDTIEGGRGADYIDGGPGDDEIFTGTNTSWDVPNIAVGGPGNDNYYLANFDDLIVEYDGEGTDTIYLRMFDGPLPVDSTTYFLPSNVENLVNRADPLYITLIYGNYLDNSIVAGSRNVTVHGGEGNDTFNSVQSPSNSLYGGPGNDTYILSGGYEATALESPGEGTDTVNINGPQPSGWSYTLPANIENLIYFEGQMAEDTIFFDSQPFHGEGNESDNLIVGGLNADILSGGDGADTLRGMRSPDLLFGGLGDDILDGGTGADLMYGGQGNDTYLADQQLDLAFENASEGTDTVTSTGSFYLYSNLENLTLLGSADNFGVGNELANVITGNNASNLLIAGAGDDQLHGGADVDSLFGEDGADTLHGDAGIDYLVGGLGNDSLYGGVNADALYGEDGDDYLDGGTSFDTDILVGGAGNDTLFAVSGQANPDYDLIDGGAGDDIYWVDTGADLTFEAVGGGNDTVHADVTVPNAGVYLYANVENLVLEGTTAFGVGNELDNALTGSASSNWLLGGLGNDMINGMGGNDVLYGEAGNDTFVFGPGNGGDVIGDFTSGQDHIQLNGQYANFAELQTHFIQNGNVGAIDLGGGNLIVLHNVTMSALTAADFMFG